MSTDKLSYHQALRKVAERVPYQSEEDRAAVLEAIDAEAERAGRTSKGKPEQKTTEQKAAA